MIPETSKSKIKALTDSVSSERWFSHSDRDALHEFWFSGDGRIGKETNAVSSHAEEILEGFIAFWSFFQKGIDPFMRVHPEALFTSSILGFESQMSFGGTYSTHRRVQYLCSKQNYHFSDLLGHCEGQSSKKHLFKMHLSLWVWFYFGKSGYDSSTPSGFTDASEVSHINGF